MALNVRSKSAYARAACDTEPHLHQTVITTMTQIRMQTDKDDPFMAAVTLWTCAVHSFVEVSYEMSSCCQFF